jgi:excisionase family DNA binding protein
MSESSGWVGLSEAAKILGAHPSTVRSWADRGELPSQRTPGGHRRFRRSDLMQWLAANQHAPASAEVQILVQSAMGRARFEIGDGQLAREGWYQRLDEHAREAMSLHGRRLMDVLQRYLAAPEDGLDQARAIGLQYGRTIREQGLSLKQAVTGFFTFNDFIFDAMIQMAEMTHPGSSSVQKVYAFTKAVIVALIDAYDEPE